MKKTANFSPCRTHRYTLWREWGGLFNAGYAVFIGLNPSTADETKDDPTIRRCIRYAQDWGYGALCMLNLFAFRATNPKEMLSYRNPVGRDNDKHILESCNAAGVIVAAWGNHGKHLGRDEVVKNMLPNLSYLKLTKTGFPCHPLYLRKGLKPVLWKGN